MRSFFRRLRELFDRFFNRDTEDDSGFPSGVVWLNHNISGWEVTAEITDLSVSGGTIRFPYDKANVWPEHPTNRARNGGPMNGNVWIIAKIDGTWYACTWEWLRVGQTSKLVSSIYGPGHLQFREFAGWRPKSGEEYYFMVSGMARDRHRTVEERSRPVKIVWP